MADVAYRAWPCGGKKSVPLSIQKGNDRRCTLEVTATGGSFVLFVLNVLYALVKMCFVQQIEEIKTKAYSKK